ncbi:putative citrate synthase [Actinacidiphila reveromycinica]|uniref:citrate synthase (unknown stereospecificity) n=1 Tax=Actinacidiphila reveromycinica TaxID=659352 RepID=A0A7U3UZH8_9ACTN|nr:citrate/2-methylcitrate synthase [Streptomyces sp. SN-593]BBB01618.1 putative citrate synthase [Streptomyces sp. SN-593]
MEPGGRPASGSGAAAPDPQERISTREAARRLGVKPETLYAYVSRGLLDSRRAHGGRGSTFDPGQVAALARRGRPAAPSDPAAGASGGTAREVGAAGAAGTPEGWGRLRTGITLIGPDRYYFRGVDAVELAASHGYEEVAEWLWTGALRPGTRFEAAPGPLAAARTTAAALPAGSGPMDRLRVAVAAAASADPLRFDLSEAAVLGTARSLIATLVDALPPAGGTRHGVGSGEGDEGDAPLAARLWPKLTTAPADEAALRVLDTALSLLIDHDLAASTLAARVAASARAHPYAVVSAGLGALDGPLHGQASALAHRMLAEVAAQGGAGPVVAEYLRAGQRVPGLGHRLYRGEDPRARALFALLDEVPSAAAALGDAREVLATAATRHRDLHANVDLALGVLSVSHGMPPQAGETVFAVSRTAGWIAHALEEYAEPPLRMRLVGAYAGPRPGRPLPEAERD